MKSNDWWSYVNILSYTIGSPRRSFDRSVNVVYHLGCNMSRNKAAVLYLGSRSFAHPHQYNHQLTRLTLNHSYSPIMSTFPTYVMPPEPRMQDDEGNMDWEAFRFWQRACRDREEALWPYYHPPTESSFSSSSSTRGLPTPDPSDHGHHPEPSQPAGGTVPLFLYPRKPRTSE